MKIIISFFVLVTASLFAQESTKELSLKGKVKRIDELYEKCPTVGLAGSNIICPQQRNVYEFDTKGNAILEVGKQVSTDYIVEKTKTKEGYVLTKYLEWNGVKRKHFEEYYTKKHVQTKILNFHNDGDLMNIWEFFYDKKGRKTEQKVTNIWNNNTNVYDHFFNEYGDIILSKFYENGKLVKEEKHDIIYKFDEKGNWVSKTIKGEFVEFYIRTILYY